MTIIIAIISALFCCSCFSQAANGNTIEDEKCLTQKMLISCSTRSPGVITCGGAGGFRGARASQAQLPLATEVLLEWDHNATAPFAAPASMATLNLELSKPSTDLGLVLLDLSGTQLCTRKSSGVQLRISFPAGPGPRLALIGLRLGSASSLSLQGNVVINADLLTGLTALERLGVAGNNISLSLEPLARYSITGAPALTNIHLVGCIHSVAYETPLFNSLASLQSVRISQSSILLLKAGSLVGLPDLRYLYLSDNNLKDLEVGSLSGLSNLAHLFLNANGLKRLVNYAFADLYNLKRLNLANNRLRKIQPNAFHGLAKLEHLDLSDNQLTTLPEMVFAQLHSLNTLNLRQNADLRHQASNDTFCPLESLATIWTDAPVDCERFGSLRLVQLVSPGGLRRSKKYDCDISELPAGQRPCHSWLDRLAPNQNNEALVRLPSSATSNELQQPSRLNIILLVIFAIVCLVHVLTTAVTIYVCRNMRRRRAGGHNGGGLMASSNKRFSASSPEEERSPLEAGSPCDLPTDPSLLVSFHQANASGGTAVAGNGAKKSSGDSKDGPSSRLNVRDKSYDFNEDETRG